MDFAITFFGPIFMDYLFAASSFAASV